MLSLKKAWTDLFGRDPQSFLKRDDSDTIVRSSLGPQGRTYMDCGEWLYLLKLLKAVDLAYLGPEDQEDLAVFAGSAVTFRNIGLTCNFYCVIEGEERTWISIRGSESWRDIFMDLKFVPENCEELNVLFHSGFLDIARTVFKDAMPYLNLLKPICVTGHSLGGAVAVILAFLLRKDGYVVDEVVTFGQPKVTSESEYQKLHEFLPLLRLVNADDLIPALPPSSVLVPPSTGPYTHFGKQITLFHDPGTFKCEDPKQPAADARAELAWANLENPLAYHRLVAYMDKIQAIIDRMKKENSGIASSIFRTTSSTSSTSASVPTVIRDFTCPGDDFDESDWVMVDFAKVDSVR